MLIQDAPRSTAADGSRRRVAAGPTTLFSHPATLHFDVPLPAGSRKLGREAADIRSFGLRYPDRLAGPLLGAAYAWRLWRRGDAFDLLVTGRCGQMYAALRGLLPLPRKPHLLLDVEWLHRHRGWWRRLLSVWDHRLIARGTWKIQVFCEAEVEAYAAYYGIDPRKFIWLPYCTDVDERVYPTQDGDYLFTGGSQNRDYDTLVRAVDGLPIELRVAAPEQHVAACREASNVRLLGTVTKEAFWSTLAGAKVVVLALDPDVMRCPGVITYVTAMRLGKCVIVNDPRGARSYIRHGKTGLIVTSRDPEAMRAALKTVLQDDALRRSLGANARDDAAVRFSGDRYRADFAALLADWRMER